MRPEHHLHSLLLLQQSLVVGCQEGEVDIRGELEDVPDILSVVAVPGLHSGQILELLYPGPGGGVLRPDQSGAMICVKIRNIFVNLLIWRSVNHKLAPLSVEGEVRSCGSVSKEEE